MLTPHCSAASGIVVPPSIVSTTRLRKSAEYGFAIHAGLLPAGSLNHIRAAMGIPDSAFPGNALMATPRMPAPPIPDLRLFITDTLGNPFIEEETLGQVYEPVAKSRRDANKVKKEQRITVVIGNPPYKEKAEGRGGWIETGAKGREAPLDHW